MDANVIYTIGLVIVILYLVVGFDDFIWDIFTFFNRFKINHRDLDLNEVSKTPPKLLAVMIAAWNEENVLEDVVNNLIASTIYPKSMYHIFLGVYPNNTETVEAARALERQHENVHVIINCLPGPTSKAQNINYVINQILEFEKQKNWKFQSFTVHDAEDVVHPYELKVTNYLIDQHPALQFPVFPIIYKPRFGNFFKNITTGTYADEFAENHFLVMRNRNNTNAFVPSAGTGFALSRMVIESFEGGDVLENGSLTEDYKLSLSLYQKNYKLHYVLERIPRVTDDHRIVWDYIATRSIFPNTFKTAVRQKTRWIMGITMQSLKFRDIFKLNDLSFVGRYSLYRDQKAKIGNLLAFVGYPVFIYFVVSLFVDLPAVYPMYSLSWYLSLMVTVEMIERQVFRGVAIYNIYGLRSVFFSCLFPPLMPLRIIWGNVINFTATAKAYRRKLFGDPVPKEKKKKDEKKKNEKKEGNEKKAVKWDKTEHSFLGKNVLRKYHRKLGDVLLEKQMIEPEELKDYLDEMEKQENHVPLGEYLIRKGKITEHQQLICLADILNKVYIQTDDFREYHPEIFRGVWDEAELRKYESIPILKTRGTVVFAVSADLPRPEREDMEKLYGIRIRTCLAKKESIEKGLDYLYHESRNLPASAAAAAKRDVLLRLADCGKVNYEQILLIRNLRFQTSLKERQAMEIMGLGIDVFGENTAKNKRQMAKAG